jgi:hypothetical protein
LKRMPAKRTTIDPPTPNIHGPSRPTYVPARPASSNPAGTSRPAAAAAAAEASPNAFPRMPRQRQPLHARPYGAPGSAGPGPRGPVSPPAPPARADPVHRSQGAADLANQKAKKMASEICRSTKVLPYLVNPV